MSYLEFADKIIAGYWSRVLSAETQILFLNAAHPTTFGHFVDGVAAALASDDPLLFQIYINPSESTEPYFPFLNVIADICKQKELHIEKFCQAAGVYPPLLPVFCSYVNDGLAHRDEDPIFDEIDYEKRQIQRSILALLAHISRDRPLVLAIGGLHHAEVDALHLLQSVAQLAPPGRVLFLTAFDGRHLPRREDASLAWDSFLSFVNEQGTAIDLTRSDTVSVVEHEMMFEAEQINLSKWVDRAQNSLQFLCLHEAVEYGQGALALFNAQPQQEQALLYSRLLFVLGEALYRMGNQDDALIYAEQLVQCGQKLDDNAILANAYRQLALTCLRKHDTTAAERYARQAIDYASRVDDKWVLLRSSLALFLVGDKFTTPIEIPIYEKLMSLAESLDAPITRMFLYKNTYFYQKYYGSFDKVLHFCDRAAELAITCQDEFSLASIYHKKGIVYSFLNDYPSALHWLQESEKIRWHLGESLEIIRICNGIGYFYLLEENFAKTFEFLNRATSLFGKIRDYNEITLTLFNVGVVHHRARQFDRATVLLDRVIQIMNILGMTRIPFRSLASLYALKGICHFRNGDWIKAYGCLSRINLAQLHSDSETACYIAMLQGLVAAHEGNVEGVHGFFQSAISCLNPAVNNNSRLLPTVYLEFGLALTQAGASSHATQQFMNAEKLALAVGHSHTAAWAQNAQDTASPLAIDLPLPSFDLEAIVALARQEVTLKKMHRMVREVKFLNLLQNVLAQSKSMYELTSEFIKLTQRYVPTRRIAIHLHEKGCWNLLTSNPEPLDLEDNGLTLIENAARIGANVCIPDLAQFTDWPHMPNDAKSLINIRLRRGENITINFMFLASTDESTLSQGDLDVLSIAASQMVTVLEKIEHEAMLIRLSTTDPLTGLANRQALQERLKHEVLRLSRYRTRPMGNASVAFFDLDNFKYYNDRFGHGIGDLVIREFGLLLKSCMRETDFVGRFGGDEFVAILTETDKDQALIAVKRVVDELIYREQFRTEIARSIGKEIDIPKDKQLTCSIGIAMYDFSEHKESHMNTLLLRADQALYRAKEAGKNRIVIWDIATA